MSFPNFQEMYTTEQGTDDHNLDPGIYMWIFFASAICMQYWLCRALVEVCALRLLLLILLFVLLLVGGRLDQRSINRRCHGKIAFGH